MCKSLLLSCVAVLGLAGCAHVETGLKAGQKALAVVDVATDKAVTEYVKLVIELRQYCAKKPDPDACEMSLYVHPDQTDKVCVPPEEHEEGPCVRGAAKSLSEAYGKTAEGMAGMENSWRVLSSQLEAVRQSWKAVKDDVAP